MLGADRTVASSLRWALCLQFLATGPERFSRGHTLIFPPQLVLVSHWSPLAASSEEVTAALPAQTMGPPYHATPGTPQRLKSWKYRVLNKIPTIPVNQSTRHAGCEA